MNTYYIYTQEEKTLEPIDENEVRALICAGKLPKDTQICPVGENTWLPLEALFPASPPTPPPPPVTPSAPVPPPASSETETSVSTEPEHKPLPHWNWDTISTKFWSFSGRMDKKTYDKSIILGALCLFCSLMVGVTAYVAHIDYLPYVESVEGSYQIIQPWGFDYFPFLLYFSAVVMYVLGFAMTLPPHVRRAHDIGISGKTLILLYIVLFAIFAPMGLRIATYESMWHFICTWLLICGIAHLFITPVLRCLPSSKKDNRYGPTTVHKPVSIKHRLLAILNFILKKLPFFEDIPLKIPYKEDEYKESKIQCTPVSKKVIWLSVLGVLSVIGLGSWAAFSFNHGTGKELYEALDDNDAKAVARCIENGAQLKGMFRCADFGWSFANANSYCSPLLFAINRNCSEDVLKILKDAGLKRSDAKGVRQVENYSYMDEEKELKWEPIKLEHDSPAYKTFKKMFKSNKKKKKKN